LSIVINYKIRKLQSFGSWILLPSSVRKRGRGQKVYLLGPLLELVLDLDRFEAFSPLPLFYLNTAAASSFRNVVVF
jgi:hypothetical protein